MGITCSREEAVLERGNVSRNSSVISKDAKKSRKDRSSSRRKKKRKAKKKRREGRRKDNNYVTDPFMYNVMLRSVEYSLTGKVSQPDVDISDDDEDDDTENNGFSSNSRTKKSMCSPQIAVELPGQHHLLFKNQQKPSSKASCDGGPVEDKDTKTEDENKFDTHYHAPTRLIIRRRVIRSSGEEGISGTHIYAVRYPKELPLKAKSVNQTIVAAAQEQSPASTEQFVSEEVGQDSGRHGDSEDTACELTGQGQHVRRVVVPPLSVLKKMPTARQVTTGVASQTSIAGSAQAKTSPVSNTSDVDPLFDREVMKQSPKHTIVDWVTVSEEHSVYVVDIGLSSADCDRLVQLTEQVCRGQYAAYTYAKQTLGCREFPLLAHTCQDAVHSIVHSLYEFSDKRENAKPLLLDDREPHMVKYDVTKRERQKLDMHTDKSEWTFLIALSNGCGVDYDGGGTYFECLDATLHVQRGHAVVFPGKLRHCGQRISSGLRFLLVGFLVDKTASGKVAKDAVIKPEPELDQDKNEDDKTRLFAGHPVEDLA